ncbi:hypothetical protein HGRIS_001595 [Hohenbuehelia grisea]|uniref:Transposase n=1 Tax=Hohenbuehelia grisea TaxID=104357 RepID=A0ABR3JJM1_9AGAR
MGANMKGALSGSPGKRPVPVSTAATYCPQSSLTFGNIDKGFGPEFAGEDSQRMANGGVLITRDELRSKLHDHFDHEFDKRMIGSKDRIERVPLNCLGPWHQLHCDGHEKLNSQALAMGSVLLPIYAFKDQFSTFVPLMDLVPNVRNQHIICHLFLDLVEQYGCVPLQLIMDKGTEVADMIRAQSRLR